MPRVFITKSTVCLLGVLICFPIFSCKSQQFTSNTLRIAGIFYSEAEKRTFEESVRESNLQNQSNCNCNFSSLSFEAITSSDSNNRSSIVDKIGQFCEVAKMANIVIFTETRKDMALFISLANGMLLPTLDISTSRASAMATLSGSLHTSLPSWPVRLAHAIPDLFKSVLWKRFAVISSNSWCGAEFMWSVKQIAQQNNFTILKTARLGSKDTSKLLEDVKLSQARIIVVYFDDVKEGESIFEAAKQMEIATSDFAWIVVTSEGQRMMKVHQLPQLVFILQPQRNASLDGIYNDWQKEKLRRGLKVLKKAFFLSQEEVFPNRSMVNASISTLLSPINSCYVSNISRRSEVFAHSLKRNIQHILLDFGETDDQKALLLSEVQLLSIVKGKPNVNIIKEYMGTWINGNFFHTTTELDRLRAFLPSDKPLRHKLRVVIVEYIPWLMLAKKGVSKCESLTRQCKRINPVNNITEEWCIYGIAVEVMIIIEKILQVELEFYYIQDGNFGAFNPRNGRWNGIMGDLTERQADMGVGLAISADRSRAVDFATVFYKVGITMITRLEKRSKLQKKSPLFKFLLPFDAIAWCCVLGIVNFFVIVLWAIEKMFKKDFTLFESTMYVWSIALGRDIGNERRPKSMAGRCVSVCLSFNAMIILAAYSANLAAFFITDNYYLPFKHILDSKLISPSSGFTYTLTRNTRQETYFKRTTNPSIRMMYKYIKQHNVTSTSKGIEMVKQGKLTALIGEQPTLEYAARHDSECMLVVPGNKEVAVTGWAFAFPQGSRWRDPVSKLMLDLEAFSTIEDIYEDWMKRISCEKTSAFNVLDGWHLSGLFIIIWMVFAMGFVSVFFVVIYRQCYRRRCVKILDVMQDSEKETEQCQPQSYCQ